MTRTKNRKKRSKGALLDFEEESYSQEKLDTLIQEAEAAIDTFDYDEAESKLKEILQNNPNNTKSMEMLSSVYMEKFEWQKAHDHNREGFGTSCNVPVVTRPRWLQEKYYTKLLVCCIEIEPDVGHLKYFSMGQLYEGLESVKLYEKGIQIIEKELENSENIEPSKELRSTLQRNLSNAYCSIAEIFMTDCCFEENAEDRCYNAINLSIKFDSTNPEAYQCLANFQLVKGEIEEAKVTVQKCISLWMPDFENLRDEVNPIEENELQNAIPEYDSRLKISKLLIELEMFYEASNILEGLLEEDDEVIDVWYLLGWLNYLRNEDEYMGNAHFYLKKAKQVSSKLQIDDECVDHINELLSELSKTHPISDDGLEEENNTNFSTDSEEKMET